jgi:methionyl-tRNA synthetase
MLMAAELPTTDSIIVNGFIVAPGGQKMSKSLGNVIDPQDVVDAFGTDGMRYFALREVHPHEDTAVSIDKIAEAYNANLANGIGNLTNRILKMAEDNLDVIPEFSKHTTAEFPEYEQAFESFNIQKAADFVWKKVGDLDQLIQDTQPFKVVKENPEKAKEIIKNLVVELNTIAFLLQPLLPTTAKKLKNCVEVMKKPEEPLFQRI